MPNLKIEVIGDFFEKIITPLSIPFSVIIGTSLGIIKYKKIKGDKNDESPWEELGL